MPNTITNDERLRVLLDEQKNPEDIALIRKWWAVSNETQGLVRQIRQLENQAMTMRNKVIENNGAKRAFEELILEQAEARSRRLHPFEPSDEREIGRNGDGEDEAPEDGGRR